MLLSELVWREMKYMTMYVNNNMIFFYLLIKGII